MEHVSEKLAKIGMHHVKTRFGANEDSEGQGQPVHLQSDQGIHCPLTQSLDPTDCISREQIEG